MGLRGGPGPGSADRWYRDPRHARRQTSVRDNGRDQHLSHGGPSVPWTHNTLVYKQAEFDFPSRTSTMLTRCRLTGGQPGLGKDSKPVMPVCAGSVPDVAGAALSTYAPREEIGRRFRVQTAPRSNKMGGALGGLISVDPRRRVADEGVISGPPGRHTGGRAPPVETFSKTASGSAVGMRSDPCSG